MVLQKDMRRGAESTGIEGENTSQTSLVDGFSDDMDSFVALAIAYAPSKGARCFAAQLFEQASEGRAILIADGQGDLFK